MSAVARAALVLGRPFAAAFLYPTCAYFLVFSRAARRASFDYLRRALGRAATWRDVFRHYHGFASTLLDRVFLYADRLDAFDCRIEGIERLRGHLAAGRGCLLMGGHFGSFEMLRAIGLEHCPVPVRVLMHETHARKMTRAMRRLNAKLPAQVIGLGRPQAMLDARDALARGEIVALLADRSLHGDRQVACSFLGSDARFPRGPFELAAKLDVPVVLFSATYLGPRRYVVRFDPLDCADPRDVDARCRAFATWLEAQCRAAPYNWFNFYDFWAAP
jgi:predicted LPLAT superfamily acyltransferase